MMGMIKPELKVVDGVYPFYGTLKLEPDRKLAEILAADTTVVAQELLTKLNATVGEVVTAGAVIAELK